MDGIVVGCDRFQEWLLPWWWTHYSAKSSYPVAFIDMGMSEEAAAWCKARGPHIKLPAIPYREPTKIQSWEKRYGDKIWDTRQAWLKKPSAMLRSPFPLSLWLDLDCQIKGNLEPLFNLFLFNACELALVRDRQNLESLLPGEVHYNSGVIAFRKDAPFLTQWIDTIAKLDLPGDQEYLSRSLFLHKNDVLDLPPIYNWNGLWGENEHAVIRHYSGGMGKIEILQSIASFSGISIPKTY